MKKHVVVGTLILLTLLVGCATTRHKMNLVVKRASFDLNCDERAEVTELGSDVYGASACGRRATYIIQCRAGVIGDVCTAIMNSDSEAE